MLWLIHRWHQWVSAHPLSAFPCSPGLVAYGCQSCSSSTLILSLVYLGLSVVCLDGALGDNISALAEGLALSMAYTTHLDLFHPHNIANVSLSLSLVSYQSWWCEQTGMTQELSPADIPHLSGHGKWLGHPNFKFHIHTNTLYLIHICPTQNHYLAAYLN